MSKHFIFDKLSDKENRLKIALQVSKLGFSHSDALILEREVCLVLFQGDVSLGHSSK